MQLLRSRLHVNLALPCAGLNDVMLSPGHLNTPPQLVVVSGEAEEA